MRGNREDIPKLKGYNCFACGTKNPVGLNLNFYRRGEYVCSDITLKKNYEGWENMAHGGIVSTLLDEVMSWSMIYFVRVFFVTRNIEIKFKKPVPVDMLLTVKGKITEGKNNRLYKAKGLIQDQGNIILAKAEATYAVLPNNSLNLVSDKLKNDMNNLFNYFSKLPRSFAPRLYMKETFKTKHQNR